MSKGLIFEWDEQKRIATLEKHGLDFIRAVRVFLGDTLVLRSGFDGEERFLAIGDLDGIEVAVIFTMRGQVVRIITARRARLHERTAYHARHA